MAGNAKNVVRFLSGLVGAVDNARNANQLVQDCRANDADATRPHPQEQHAVRGRYWTELETVSGSVAQTRYQRNEQMSSMIAALAETAVGMSDQTDASVARLQAIEKQVELAFGRWTTGARSERIWRTPCHLGGKPRPS